MANNAMDDTMDERLPRALVGGEEALAVAAAFAPALSIAPRPEGGCSSCAGAVPLAVYNDGCLFPGAAVQVVEQLP